MNPVRSFLATAALMLVAGALAGCPAATGRRRGPTGGPDGGPCATLTDRPVTGERCAIASAVCDFEAPCESDRLGRSGLAQTVRCSCVSGQWRCAPIEACFERLPDGGAACPTADIPSGLTPTCTERHLGQSCVLPLFQCPDGSRPPVACMCDGSFWQCATPACRGVVGPDAGGVRAGAPCESELDCRGLTCDTSSVPGGHCTGPCMPSGSQANEAAQCGGTGTTCLATDQGDSFCSQSCRTSGAASGCRRGFVCTGLWFAQASGEADSAGCFPWCQEDVECVGGQRCNERTGQCGEPSNRMGLPDGSPCPLDEVGACRGSCLRVSEDGRTGVCGSFIDLARTRECPDGPEVQPMNPGRDNLAICAFRQCDAGACCPAGLVCEGDGDVGVCIPDDPMSPNINCRANADAGAGDR